MNRGFFALALLILSTIAFACAEPASPRAVEFTICARDQRWTPPSPEAQAQFLATLPRYAQPADEPLREEFREALGQRFFQSYGANSGLQDFMRLSGIWSAEQFQLPSGCGDSTPLASGERGDLWLLLHEPQRLTLEGDELFLTVAPTGSGFEVIQWDNPLAPKVWSPALHILDEEGDEIHLFPAFAANPKQVKSGG